MAGIEDLKLWRTEPFMKNFQEWQPNPDHPKKYRYPLQGRWFSTHPYYSWLGPDTIIKELDTKLPFNYYDKAGQIEIPGEGFTMKGVKSAAHLAKDKALLEEWFPPEEFGKVKTTTDFPPGKYAEWKTFIKDFWKRHKGEQVGRYTKNPLVSYPKELEAQAKLAELKNMPITDWEKSMQHRLKTGNTMGIGAATPPLNIVNQAKLNLWESFKQNFMDYSQNNKWTPDERITRKGIYQPKSRLENIMRLPHKAADIWQRYKAGQPIKSGIPWSKIGMGILNNPVTRTVGGLGNVALAGQAFLDIGTGSQHTKNMMTDINRFAGAPMDRQGRVIQSVPTYRNLQKAAQRDVLNPNEMRGVTSFDTTRYDPHTMNAGGIASLVV